jgi:hypothetical protein
MQVEKASVKKNPLLRSAHPAIVRSDHWKLEKSAQPPYDQHHIRSSICRAAA